MYPCRLLAESANIVDLCDESEGLDILRARYEGTVEGVWRRA